MEQKRPRSREKNVTGGGKGVHKRGEGLGSGPVGNSSGYSNQGSTEKQSPKRDFSGGGRKNPIILILILLAAGVMGLFPNGTSNPSNNPAPTIEGNSYTENTEQLNTSVDAKARTKRTKILGNGQDIVTIMVYMCGTDLESNHGMATADLQEMMAADLGENVNLLVYTGGCTKWKNSAVSSQTNQIYQIKDGNLISHVKDAGQVSMTDPSTLTEFIKWCQKYFPANRNELIFWDHGGGSVSGYGYDQKYPRSGSMNLAGISQALKNANMTFDFIGFDACLMATAENALMLTKYGDYLIASEETEPGVGWYYTDWLTALGKNPSLSTVELGKQIVDDFVETCAKKCRGQKTTLSVVDLEIGRAHV